MRATANKKVEGIKFVRQGRRSEIYKNQFEEMKSTRRECTLYYGEKAATK